MKMIGHSTKKNLLKLMIILGIILLIEIIVFLLFKRFNKEDICDNEYVKVYNDVLIIDDGYISVGYNDYNNTEDAKYIDNQLINQGEITKFDKDFNPIWVTSYYLDGNVELTGITKSKDGYIAIGIEEKTQEKDRDYTGIILKLDKEGKILNSVTYDLLHNTTFNKIIRDNNSNIIIGSSQYEIDRVGNHLGGGIILKVDDDLNIIEQNNYGGNKSGEFNNIFILNDSYLVTGYDAGYPVIVKFKKDFNRDKEDTDLISKKIIYNKTIDKKIEFIPIYYSDNKLYDGVNIFDLNDGSYKSLNKNIDPKKVLLINENNVYVFNKRLLKYDRDLNLIDELEVEKYLIKLIPYNNDFIYIGYSCNDCICTPSIKMLSRQQ